jgi:hypothetical protein
LTGEIFVTTEFSGQQVGQLTNIILRYEANGQFDTNWDTFKVACNVPCYSPDTESLLFDSSGNLWVATAYGTGATNPIFILEYLAADLSMPNPPAQPSPIMANMYRGDQMAFNASGDLCISTRPRARSPGITMLRSWLAAWALNPVGWLSTPMAGCT